MRELAQIEDGSSLNQIKHLPDWFDPKDPKEQDDVPIDWVIKDYCSRGEITLIGGKAGCGKSLLNQYMLSTRKCDFMNIKPGGTLYLTGADADAATITRRGHKFENVGLHYQELPAETLCLAKNRGWMTELGDCLISKGYDSVIFDTLADFHEGSLNEAEKANQTMSGFKFLATYANVAVIIITHTTKGSNWKLRYAPDDIADSRIFMTKSDYCFGLVAEPTSEGKLIDLHQLKNRHQEDKQPIRALIRDYHSRISIEYSQLRFSSELDELAVKEQRENRDAAVKQLSSAGKSQREIAAEMGCSIGTVNNILKSLN